MRGSKAKILRALAYEGSARKYGHNRLYEMVKSPGQWRHKMALTIIADEERYLYQALKGRRVQLEPILDQVQSL
jgi:hypothetical protein